MSDAGHQQCSGGHPLRHRPPAAEPPAESMSDGARSWIRWGNRRMLSSDLHPLVERMAVILDEPFDAVRDHSTFEDQPQHPTVPWPGCASR